MLSAPVLAFTHEFPPALKLADGSVGQVRICTMYLSYLMGAEQISDQELSDLGIEIVETTKSGNRKLKIPSKTIEGYRALIREKMTRGFWNEFLDEQGIYYVFKFTDGHIEEYTLSPQNEQTINNLCNVFNDEPPEKTANLYKYISDNDFYHDFMLKHYRELIER